MSVWVDGKLVAQHTKVGGVPLDAVDEKRYELFGMVRKPEGLSAEGDYVPSALPSAGRLLLHMFWTKTLPFKHRQVVTEHLLKKAKQASRSNYLGFLDPMDGLMCHLVIDSLRRCPTEIHSITFRIIRWS